MPLKNLLIIAVIAPALAFCATLAGNASAIAVIDRVFDAVKHGILPPSDIRILEHAAEGRLEETDVAVIS